MDSHIKCRFSQGLDIRLLDNENSKLLSELNYMGNYTFAFDDYSYLPSIEKKVDLLSWRTPYQVRLFIYCHPDMILSNICKRVNWCKANKMLPYIMRHIDCWGSRYEEFYTDLAAFCNQPEFFKKLTFNQFLNKRHKDLKRVVEHSKLYEEHILCPD